MWRSLRVLMHTCRNGCKESQTAVCICVWIFIFICSQSQSNDCRLSGCCLGLYIDVEHASGRFNVYPPAIHRISTRKVLVYGCRNTHGRAAGCFFARVRSKCGGGLESTHTITQGENRKKIGPIDRKKAENRNRHFDQKSGNPLKSGDLTPLFTAKFDF